MRWLFPLTWHVHMRMHVRSGGVVRKLLTIFAIVGLSGDGALAATTAHVATQPAPVNAKDVTPPETPPEPPLRKLMATAADKGLTANEVQALAQFYNGRNYRGIFADETGLTRAAHLVSTELAHAPEWGLNAADYPLQAANVPPTNNGWSSEQAAAAEFELATGLLKYARYARGGRITNPTEVLSGYLDRQPVLPDPAAVLADVTTSAQPDAALRAYHPQHDQFRRLHDAYAKLIASKPSPSAERIADAGPMIVPEAKSAEISVLRRQLGIAADGDPEVYDDALIEAVKSVQRAARVAADGLVGPKTRRILAGGGDAAEDEHLQALRANMEMWRWMPADLGVRHLFVNVPSFTIDLVAGGKTELSERVIVGKPATPTPIFSKYLTTIVLRPSWLLPDSIKLEKLRSAQRRGGSVEDEGYRIMKGKREVKSWNVNWEDANLTAYQFVQPSGDGNALGNVKFLFPNRHSVYLHDTPMKSLFSAEERLFSHGCVRLRNPLSLAQKLLDDEKGEGELNAAKLARSGPGNNEFKLERPLPIHIGYFTVWVTDEGEVEYLGDPYGHQERVTLALQGRWKDIDREEEPEPVEASDLKEVRASPAREKSREETPRAAARASQGAARVSENNEDSIGASPRFERPSGMMRIGRISKPEPMFDAAKPQKVAAQRAARPRRDSVGDMIRSSLGGF